MFLKNLKVVPLLIVVAMLAFSVRLIDFAAGVSALAGAAYAEEKKEEAAHADAPKEATPAEAAKAPDPNALAGSMDKDKKGTLQFPDPKAPAGKDAKDGAIGWQSPTDMDVDFSKSRKELEDEMTKRRADLDKREKELQTKEALLKAGEQELDRKLQELSQLRSEIENLLNKQSDEENARVASLVKIYEGMKPADAARIFDSLDLDVLMAVMSKMSERKLSPVMAAMNPDRAKTITIMLAQQKQLPQLPPSQ